MTKLYPSVILSILKSLLILIYWITKILNINYMLLMNVEAIQKNMDIIIHILKLIIYGISLMIIVLHVNSLSSLLNML